MSKDIYTPTEFRENIYTIIENINNSHSEVQIINKRTNNSVVVLDSNDWNEIKETLYLLNTGVLNVVNERKSDDSGFTEIDSSNWREL